MCKDVIMEYVRGAMIDPKNYKKFLLVSGCVAMFGIIPGVLLKSYWLYIGVVMLLIFFICVCIMFGLSFKELTLKRKIKIQALIYVCWYLQIGLLSAIIYTHTYGINYKLFLLYLPSLLLCLFLFIATSVMLKNGKFTPKHNSTTKVFGGSLSTVVVGWTMGSLLDNATTKDAAAPIVLVGFTIINTVLSIGFLNFQKLYYLDKMKRLAESHSNDSIS